jgi:hypothetical protein
MNAFLVVGRSALDDIPMLLSGNRDEALQFASCLSREDIIAAAEDVYGVDVGVVLSAAVVEFRDGEAVGADVVLEFPFDGENEHM